VPSSSSELTLITVAGLALLVGVGVELVAFDDAVVPEPLPLVLLDEALPFVVELQALSAMVAPVIRATAAQIRRGRGELLGFVTPQP
jgi:hypothetical protein